MSKVNEKREKDKKELYNTYGWGIRAITAGLVVNMLTMLCINWEKWYINIIIAIVLIIALCITIRKAIMNKVFVCSNCGKFIWTNQKDNCKGCGNRIF